MSYFQPYGFPTKKYVYIPILCSHIYLMLYLFKEHMYIYRHVNHLYVQ